MGRSFAEESIVYRICLARDWALASASGLYAGTPDDARDGFLHLSRECQVAATGAKYFCGKTDLVIVALDVARLGPALRWETSRNGEVFPHLYGPVPATAALWVHPMPLGYDGTPRLPLDGAPC